MSHSPSYLCCSYEFMNRVLSDFKASENLLVRAVASVDIFLVVATLLLSVGGIVVMVVFDRRSDDFEDRDLTGQVAMSVSSPSFTRKFKESHFHL
jgi:16S rRNA G527 N7-methylase RsmG